MAQLNRQQRRAFEQRQRKIKDMLTSLAKPLSRIVAMDTIASYDAGIICGRCGKAFKIQVDADERMFQRTSEDQGAAVTGQWHLGACPACGLAHRIRHTLFVNIETEDVDTKTGTDVPSANDEGATPVS